MHVVAGRKNGLAEVEMKRVFVAGFVAAAIGLGGYLIGGGGDDGVGFAAVGAPIDFLRDKFTAMKPKKTTARNLSELLIPDHRGGIAPGEEPDVTVECDVEGKSISSRSILHRVT